MAAPASTHRYSLFVGDQWRFTCRCHWWRPAPAPEQPLPVAERRAS